MNAPPTDYGASSGKTGTNGVMAFLLSCAVGGAFIYCSGGSGPTSKVFFAKLSSSGVGAWKETTDYGAASGHSGTGGVPIAENSCIYNSGHIYCVGGFGTGFVVVSKVFYAPVSSAGVGAWKETTDYGAISGNSGTGGIPIHGTACVNGSGYVVCVDGDTTGNTATADVFFAKVSSTGVGAWTQSANYGTEPHHSLISFSPRPGYHVSCARGPSWKYVLCSGSSSSAVYGSTLTW